MKTRSRQSTGQILLIGTAIDCPDLVYATGFRAVDPVVCLCTERKRHLVVPGMEAGRADRTTEGVAILTPEQLGLAGRRRLSEWCAALLRKESVTRVTVAPSFPLGVARALEHRGIRLDVATTPLFAGRAVKRAEEVRNITDAQQAAVIAMRAAIALIAGAEIGPGGILRVRGRVLTSEEVKRRIAQVLLDHDCQERDTIVACGPESADPHATGEGPLCANEPIVIDIFPQHSRHGYWGDITRTVVRGTASPRLRRMYAAVRAAQSRALACLRGGVGCATVHRAAARELKRRGFRTEEIAKGRYAGFIHSTGHGVGLQIHEGPTLAAVPGRLRAGNVVTVEPGLYYPDTGGVRIEDTVLVTAHGWRYLVPCEKRLEV